MAEHAQRVDGAERQLAAEVDAVPEWRCVRDPLERKRQARRRKERPGEEEQRQDDEAVDGNERGVRILGGRVARERCGERGVEAIAKYCRVQRNEPITGQVASPAAICIAVAASMPGATKSMYGTPNG